MKTAWVLVVISILMALALGMLAYHVVRVGQEKTTSTTTTSPAAPSPRQPELTSSLTKIQSPIQEPHGSPTRKPLPTLPPVKASGRLKVAVSARFYSSLKDVLIQGDRITGIASRVKHDMPLTEAKFADAIAPMNAVDTTELGVEKGIAFSALDDVKTFITKVPKDIDWISFNMERGLTPNSDMGRGLVTHTMIEFAQLVRKHGFRPSWGPTRDAFDVMERGGELKNVLVVMDSVAFQGQLLLSKKGLDGFRSEVTGKAALFRKYNPRIEIVVQLVLGVNSTDEIVAAFKSVEDVTDLAVIFSLRDPRGAREVIEKLRGS